MVWSRYALGVAVVFSSLSFLLLFLPAALGVYYVLPWQMRNAWLLLASLAFYAFGEPRLVLVLIAEILVNWALGRRIARVRGTWRGKALLVTCLLIDLGVLAVFKYASFAVETANAIMGLGLPVPNIALPIGISFYTFQEISYVVDVHRGTRAQESPIDLGLYLALFPQLIAGPIVRYGDMEPQLRRRESGLDDIRAGMGRFGVGMCKKVLLANPLGGLVDEVFLRTVTPDVPPPLLWLAVVAYALQIYLDFSGYSDMAIGLGRMFGFRLPENFRDPYCAGTATEFWRRWHISLSSWFRDYVYIPLGGSRGGSARTVCNLLVVWSLTGLWHGAGWNFVLWGLGWGVLLVLEKFVVVPDGRGKAFRVAWRILVLVCTLLLWVLFRAEDLGAAASVLRGMFAPSAWADWASRASWVWVRLHDLVVQLAVAIAIAAGVPSMIKGHLPSEGTAREALGLVGTLVLLLLCVVSFSFIVQGSYNPFLYFQF